MNEWTDEELELAATNYLEMLAIETTGGQYVKADFRRKLETKIQRSRPSIEYRHQNISSILAMLDMPYISGYKPMKNVGTNVRERLMHILKKLGHIPADAKIDIDDSPVPDSPALENAVRKLRIRGFKKPPIGQLKPSRVQHVSERIPRDPAVKAWVLENAKGDCEMCELPGPFVTTDGENYLEVHHVRWLSQNGSDTITNAVALCPNCHREAHYGSDPDGFIRLLLERVSRLKLEKVLNG